MAMTENMEVVELDVSRAWSARRRSGPVRVEVLDGTVHLTVEGDPADHVLQAGDAFEGPQRRWVVAAGLSPSQVRVSSPPALPTLARVASRNAGRLARHLLGGTLIVAVWLSLWTWLAVGVVGPLSTVP
jgi:ferric-dicitrate binding protein FerR (iron transport regulator)